MEMTMQSIQNVLKNAYSPMVENVVRYRLRQSKTLIDNETYEMLVYFTTKFALEDTFQLDTKNPVIYGIAVHTYLEFLFEDLKYPSMERFSHLINEAISENYHEFLDEITMFTQNNINMIEKKGELE